MSALIRFLLCGASALLLSGLTGVSAETAKNEASAPDPLQQLRIQQKRLFELDFAVKEAELLQRLCALRPNYRECIPSPEDLHQAFAADNELPEDTSVEDRKVQAREFQISEIYGSNGNLIAILLGPDGKRLPVRAGASIGSNLTVQRIGRDSVIVADGAELHVLQLIP